LRFKHNYVYFCYSKSSGNSKTRFLAMGDCKNCGKMLSLSEEGAAFKMVEVHGHDTEKQIFFYEHEFYVFSNFSAFMIHWKGKLYPTSEHAYHAEKFGDENLKAQIRSALSAHDALKLAHEHKDKYRTDWDNIKLNVMKEILRAKASQHPYAMKKLLESGDRELIEDSWRDPYWGWGPNKDGENHLGKLWMELRDELKNSANKEAVLS